jgi:hypothetical protein
LAWILQPLQFGFFSFDLIVLNILHQTIAYASSIHNSLDSLAQIFIFSVVGSQAVLISTSSSEFSKVVILYEIEPSTILYPLLHVISWDWTSPYEICALFVYSLRGSSYLLPPPDNGHCHSLLPWKIRHQVHLNAVSCLSKYGQFDFVPMKRCSSKFMNVVMWEHCTSDNQVLGCGRVTTQTLLLLIITNFV